MKNKKSGASPIPGFVLNYYVIGTIGTVLMCCKTINFRRLSMFHMKYCNLIGLQYFCSRTNPGIGLVPNLPFFAWRLGYTRLGCYHINYRNNIMGTDFSTLDCISESWKSDTKIIPTWKSVPLHACPHQETSWSWSCLRAGSQPLIVEQNCLGRTLLQLRLKISNSNLDTNQEEHLHATYRQAQDYLWG